MSEFYKTNYGWTKNRLSPALTEDEKKRIHFDSLTPANQKVFTSASRPRRARPISPESANILIGKPQTNH